MVARIDVAAFGIDGLERAAVEHLVNAEIEAVRVIGDCGAESGVRVCVMHVFATYCPDGITVGDVVEVTGHDERSAD